MNDDSLQGQTILVINTGFFKKKFILQLMKKMGLKVICLNREKIAWAKPFVDHWIIADTNNHKECIEAVKLFMIHNPKIQMGGVITFWEACTQLSSKIADTFNFVGIPYNVSKRVRNKYQFRDFCRDNGIRAPQHQLLQHKKDIPLLEKKLSYPMVIKPVYGQSSAFVMLVNNREELLESYEYVRNNIKSFELSPEWDNFEIFVEEYIDGDEVDIDILIQNGKIKFYTISDNYNKSRDKFFVDSGQAVPSSLPKKEQQGLIDMAEETLEKLGITDGCIHFEAKSTKNGPVPIEVNLRMGGDYVCSYIEAAWGVNLVEYAVRIALGQYIKIHHPENPRRYVIGWDIQTSSSGILVELNVDKALPKKPYIEDIHFTKEIGDAVLMPPEGYDNLGWITVSGDNLLDAQDNLKEALKHITYKVVGFDEESTIGKTSRKNSLSAAVVKKDQLLKAAKIEKVRRASRGDQRSLHIGIAANTSGYSSNTQQYQFKVIAKEIEKTLQERGYTTTIFDFNNIAKAIIELKNSNIDLVLNVSEGIDGLDILKPQAAAILESLQIPYTGTNATNLALCRDKIRVKKLLAYHDIPTPKWDYAYNLGETIRDDLRYPLMVKPGNADRSFGITNKSVVSTKNQLKVQLDKIITDLGRPALVEEYIEGDEYVVSFLGTSGGDIRVLPLSRSNFKKMPPQYWHIYTRDIKQRQNDLYKMITIQNPVKNISKKLEAVITEIALDTYKILHCNDYGIVEIRVDEDDNPYVLEVDPNPILAQQGTLTKAAKLVGLGYGDLLEEIISLAITRYQSKRGYYDKYIE